MDLKSWARVREWTISISSPIPQANKCSGRTLCGALQAERSAHALLDVAGFASLLAGCRSASRQRHASTWVPPDDLQVKRVAVPAHAHFAGSLRLCVLPPVTGSCGEFFRALGRVVLLELRRAKRGCGRSRPFFELASPAPGTLAVIGRREPSQPLQTPGLVSVCSQWCPGHAGHENRRM